MSLINQDELNAIARLSALSLTDEERVSFTKQLNTIVEYVSSLQKVVTSTQPLAQREYLLREDVAVTSHSNDILALAPQKRDHYFAVPQILE